MEVAAYDFTNAKHEASLETTLDRIWCDHECFAWVISLTLIENYPPSPFGYQPGQLPTQGARLGDVGPFWFYKFTLIVSQNE
jgi:hypothetical protein